MNKNTQTINLLLGTSLVLRIALLGWQLHRMYRLEMAEMRAAEEQGRENEPTLA